MMINQEVDSRRNLNLVESKGSNLLSLRQVMNRISMGRTFIYQEIAAGRFRPIKVGSSTRFLESDIEKWITLRVLESRGIGEE